MEKPGLASPFLYGLEAVQKDIIPYSKLLTTVKVCLFVLVQYTEEKNGNKVCGPSEPGFAMASNNQQFTDVKVQYQAKKDKNQLRDKSVTVENFLNNGSVMSNQDEFYPF